jgi:hypothetical protein
MSKCLELAVDVIHHILTSNFREALESAEELVVVLRTYKESC